MTQKRIVDPGKELGNITFGGKRIVNNPREVIRVLNQMIDLAKSDQYQRPSYQLTKDRNAAAVANAMMNVIVGMYTQKNLKIPKDAAKFKKLTDGVKTSFDVKTTITKLPGGAVPRPSFVTMTPKPAKITPKRTKALTYKISFRAGNSRRSYKVVSKEVLPDNPFALRKYLRTKGSNITSIAVSGASLISRGRTKYNDDFTKLNDFLNQAIKERRRITVAKL